MTNQPLEIRSDNMQLVKQMKGEWKVRGGSYVARYASAMKLISEFASVTFSWIPGELNQEADELTRVAYRRFLLERGTRRISS
jgi:ribonuclease HI